jgi:hypothetical protein
MKGVGAWKNARENIVGKTYNFLTVLELLPTENQASMVLCSCVCGNIRKYYATAIKTGNTKSCGCFALEQQSKSGIDSIEKNSRAGKRWLYRGKYFRSFVELLYAWHLVKNNIEFKYEPETFKLADGCRYKPDFHLIADNKYVEIKGSEFTYSVSAKHKVNLFSKFNDVEVLFAKDVVSLLGNTYSYFYYQYVKKGWRPE